MKTKWLAWHLEFVHDTCVCHFILQIVNKILYNKPCLVAPTYFFVCLADQGNGLVTLANLDDTIRVRILINAADLARNRDRSISRQLVLVVEHSFLLCLPRKPRHKWTLPSSLTNITPHVASNTVNKYRMSKANLCDCGAAGSAIFGKSVVPAKAFHPDRLFKISSASLMCKSLVIRRLSHLAGL